MDHVDTPGRHLRTVETAFDFVEAVKELNGAGVTELAEHLGIAPSTAHGYLSTLVECGYLVKEGNHYYIGLEFLVVGGYAVVRRPAYRLIHSKVDRLAEQTGERVQFIVEENGRGIYLRTAIGDNAVEVDARIGKQSYLHNSAAGKAILASLQCKHVEGILDQWGLPEMTKTTITDRETLYEELDTVRERGYAINDEESIKGLRSVGASITAPDGNVVGALSISGPSHRMNDKWSNQEVSALLLGVTNELELNLKYQ